MVLRELPGSVISSNCTLPARMSTQTLQDELDTYRRKLDVDYFDITLREIIRMAIEKELHTAPEYQRKFRWSREDESRLVESLFLGLPVPSIFVAANRDGTWEVVDGLQRISTVLHFAGESPEALKIVGKSEPLRLTGLNTLKFLNDKTFAEVPTPLQLGFNKRMLRITALSDKSDPEIRFDMFERLNTGGIALTPQEVRSCVYRGEFMDLVEDLAGDGQFRSLLKLRQGNENDGTREELVLKMFAYLFAREKFSGQVKEFLNTFAKEDAPPYSTAQLRDLFHRVMTSLTSVVAGPIVRKNVPVTPLNQLEAIMVAAAELIREGTEKFAPKDGWLDDAELVHFSTKGTNSRTMLNGRINRAKELLRGAEVKEQFTV